MSQDNKLQKEGPTDQPIAAHEGLEERGHNLSQEAQDVVNAELSSKMGQVREVIQLLEANQKKANARFLEEIEGVIDQGKPSLFAEGKDPTYKYVATVHEEVSATFSEEELNAFLIPPEDLNLEDFLAKFERSIKSALEATDIENTEDLMALLDRSVPKPHPMLQVFYDKYEQIRKDRLENIVRKIEAINNNFADRKYSRATEAGLQEPAIFDSAIYKYAFRLQRIAETISDQTMLLARLEDKLLVDMETINSKLLSVVEMLVGAYIDELSTSN